MVTGLQQTEATQPTPRGAVPGTADHLLLQHRAQRLAHLAVQLFRWRAVLWWLTATLATTLLLVMVDHMIHAEEAGLRWLISLVWLLVVVAAAWQLLRPAWNFSLTAVRAAQWIEQLRPDLHGRLSNALAIAELPENDPRFGSHSFRLAALNGSIDQSDTIDWQRTLDYRPTLRAGLCAFGLCLVGGAIAAASPSLAQRGLQRLFNPWLAAPWPHADELRFVELPAMIASGSELHIEVIDGRPPLPARVELEVRSLAADASAGNSKVILMPMRVLQDVAIVALPDVRSSLAVRARGGDDQDSPWQQVQVAEVPELLEHQFHVVPPAYSRQPAADLVGQRIEVLAGSRVTFHGTSSRRLRSVTAIAVHEGRERPQALNGADSGSGLAGVGSVSASSAGVDPARADSARGTSNTSIPAPSTAASLAQSDPQPQQWQATLLADRQAFDLFSEAGGLAVDSDRRWQLEFETEEGLQVREPKTWSIHAVADRPPTMNLLPIEPPGITREATVNLFGNASDDLELVEVRMVWRAGEESESHGRTLWPERLTDSTSSPTLPVQTTAGNSSGDQPRVANIRFQWRPADENLPSGQTISIALEARDSAGQITRSPTQTLQVQDAQAVLAHIQAEEAKTFEPLRQILDAQRRTHQVVNRTRDMVRDTHAVEAAQLEAISGARQSQHSIAQQLAQSQSSVLNQLQSLSEQLSRNGLSESDSAKHISTLSSQIERLTDEAILPAVKELEEAQRLMRATGARASPQPGEVMAMATQMEKAAGQQQRAVESLRQIVDSIATAETTAGLRQEFSDLLARQNEVRSETERLQVDRVLHPESRDGQSKQVGLRSDQQSLARAVDDLASTIDKHLQGSSDANSPALQTLEQARKTLIEQQVSQQMRDAAELVRDGQLTAGIRVQQSAAEALANAADKFSASESSGLESSSANLQHTANRLSELAQTESRLAERMHQASQSPNSETQKSEPQNTKPQNSQPRAGERDERAELAQQQTQLAEKAAELSSELRRRSDAKLSEAVDEAQQRAAEAAQQARDEQFAKASESAEQAAEQFALAHEAVRQRAAELERQIVNQKLLDLGSAIAELVRLQIPVVEKLNELKDSRAGVPDQLGAAWEAKLRSAGSAQEGVRLRLAATIASAEAVDPFAWLLAQCEIDMTRAVAALERGRLAPDALASADSALRKLVAANQSLSDEQQAAASREGQPKSADQTSGAADSQSSHGSATMASLKLLRALQADINERTEKLRSIAADAASPEMLRLSEEQKALAEQTQKVQHQLLK